MNEVENNNEQGTPENELDPRVLFALITVENHARNFVNTDLKQATDEFNKAKQALAVAESKVKEVQGGIAGAEILINRELQNYGVSVATYVRQRDAFLEIELAKIDEKTAALTNKAEVLTEQIATLDKASNVLPFPSAPTPE